MIIMNDLFNKMDEVYRFSISTGVVLSFVSSIFLLVTHYSVKRMRKHPGPIVLCLCISQITLDLNWITGLPAVYK